MELRDLTHCPDDDTNGIAPAPCRTHVVGLTTAAAAHRAPVQVTSRDPLLAGVRQERLQ